MIHLVWLIPLVVGYTLSVVVNQLPAGETQELFRNWVRGAFIFALASILTLAIDRGINAARENEQGHTRPQ